MIAVSATAGDEHPAVVSLGVIGMLLLWWVWKLTLGIESIERTVIWASEAKDSEQRTRAEESLMDQESRSVWTYILP